MTVNTHRGVVPLSGFVESSQIAQRVGEIARSVEGVKSVGIVLRVAP